MARAIVEGRIHPGLGGRARLQRDPGPAPELLTADKYVGKNAFDIGRDLLKEMEGVDLPTPSVDFVSWKADAKPLVASVTRAIALSGFAMWAILSETLAPASLVEPVNRGRDADKSGNGPADYKPAVALELRKILTTTIDTSLKRLIARYLAARNQAALKGESQQGEGLLNPPEPAAKDIIPSHPIDTLVAKAMTGDVFNFHVLAYRKAKPEETKQHDLEQLRPITFEFELQNGMWTWARVTSPADPKPEEVAKELYGFPGLAVHLLGAAPLFGFKPSRLTAAHQQRWKEKAARRPRRAARAARPPTVTRRA